MRYFRIKHTLGLAVALLTLFHGGGVQAQDRLRHDADAIATFQQFLEARPDARGVLLPRRGVLTLCRE